MIRCKEGHLCTSSPAPFISDRSDAHPHCRNRAHVGKRQEMVSTVGKIGQYQVHGAEKAEDKKAFHVEGFSSLVGRLVPREGSGLLLVFLLEFLETTGRIDEHLLTRVERMGS